MNVFRRIMSKVFKDPDFQDTYSEDKEFRRYNTSFLKRVETADHLQKNYLVNLIAKYHNDEKLIPIEKNANGYSILVKLYLETEITKYPFPLIRNGKNYVLNPSLTKEETEDLIISLAPRGYYFNPNDD